MNDQIKYYSRQVKLIGENGLLKLSNASVLVIGAGGLGCPVLQYIATMGVGSIGVIDNDEVDISNLHRQILFTHEDLGCNKSVIAVEKIKKLNPYIKVVSYTEKLNSENINKIFENYELIVDCTDNFETKFLVHDFSYLNRKKLVQAGLYQYEGSLHVFDYSNNKNLENLPCLRCLWTEEPQDGATGTCAEVGIIGPTAGVLGTLMATEVSKLILELNPLENGVGLFVDLTTQDFEKRRWNKNLNCSLCSLLASEIQALGPYKIDLNKLSNDMEWIDLRTDLERIDFPIIHEKYMHKQISDFTSSDLDPNQLYLLICQRGFRSQQIARALRADGLKNFYSLVDGVKSLKLKIPLDCQR